MPFPCHPALQWDRGASPHFIAMSARPHCHFHHYRPSLRSPHPPPVPLTRQPPPLRSQPTDSLHCLLRAATRGQVCHGGLQDLPHQLAQGIRRSAGQLQARTQCLSRRELPIAGGLGGLRHQRPQPDGSTVQDKAVPVQASAVCCLHSVNDSAQTVPHSYIQLAFSPLKYFDLQLAREKNHCT